MPLERKKILMLQGLVVYERFLLSGRKFFVQFFLFSEILSAYTSFRCWFSALLFSRTGFFLALHTLCFIVFWKSSFVVRCSTTAYFSSFFFGSGLSSVTGHTTFHKHIGPSKNSIIICINRKGGFRSCSHITPVVNLRKAKREWKVNQFFLY